MSRGINKTISIGNLCADPDTRYLPSGAAVANCRLAMNGSYKDKSTGQKVETCEYISVVFFNRLAEIAGEYLKKGSKVYIEGSLRTRKWTDQSGADRWSTEIVAERMEMLDSRPDGGQRQPAQPSNQGYGQGAQHRTAPQQSEPQGQGQGQQPPFDPNAFDDIPFN